MLRRLAVTAVTSAAASLAAICAMPPASYAAPASFVPPPVSDADDADHLTVTVSGAGAADGRYELDCHPAGGSHPDARAACEQLDRRTSWGRDPFAPASRDGLCTMQYGGPATARVTGTWAGRPVDAAYGRGDGCEIARWNDLVPVLPELGR
ncbi:SSI family serine proteinase inhibitor [Streptomyces fructofermentans]|uniref:Subtilisin inhibitor domain-containing protein n=1 Tax=Streptomyces fructofermentans TaxID=152141 RepID=A0A918U0Z4_9ACTN|nr:SSI family serine proteinase inhibitor [Streptomyces fructofermentans]GGX79326.1 hypothetical protein GCM10010515_53850 [Streptomyces fructofermentans]